MPLADTKGEGTRASMLDVVESSLRHLDGVSSRHCQTNVARCPAMVADADDCKIARNNDPLRGDFRVQ